jgi:hypothetical protein
MLNLDLLRAIANATQANAVVYVTKEDGLPLLQHNPPLITVDVNNVDPNDNAKIGAKITIDGVKKLQVDTTHTKPVSAYQVATGLVLPKVKRGGGGGGGAPSKYPFDTMDVGAFFFVPNTDVKNGDAMKTVSSAVGSANQRFMEETGEHETVTRAKRGKDHKTVKDAVTGENVNETVTIAKKRSTKKFTIRAVQAGVEYGSFKAPADGAVVMRTL